LKGKESDAELGGIVGEGVVEGNDVGFFVGGQGHRLFGETLSVDANGREDGMGE
jgi:hypothetical protein